jgi:hypothetical protein
LSFREQSRGGFFGERAFLFNQDGPSALKPLAVSRAELDIAAAF